MVRSRLLRDLAVLAVLTGVYFVAGKLGLRLACVNASATAVWPCTGIALAACLLLGYRVWPAVFVGAFLVNLTTAGSALTSLGIATGNTLEAVVACYLVMQFARGRRTFERAQDVFKFTVLAGMVSTTISATIGVTSLELAGLVSAGEYAPVWSTWWLGDGVGAVVVTPLILLWWENPRIYWTRRQILELGLLFGGLFLSSWILFSGRFHSAVKNYPLEYTCVPFLIWAAFRFGRRKAATAVAALSAISTWGTLHGFGPFSRDSQNTSLLLLQTFTGIMALTILMLAAEVSEHKRAEEHVHRLAVSDPLTGIANYRHLLAVLDREIKRHARSQRIFAVLLLDLDGLKKINDAHGHLVGSRALCRLANVLKTHCREIDTAARYGGDEFVLVLPETGMEAANQVANRVSEALRKESEAPRITVSTGMAVFPRDGKSVEELFGAADRALYGEKRSAKAAAHLRG